MLQQTTPPADQTAASPAPSPQRASDALPLFRTAVRLAEQAGEGPILYVAADDVRALRLYEMLRCLLPEACVLHLPASDALPGDDAPSSPANAGLRVAALRRLHGWREAADTTPLLCVTAAEATAQAFAPRDAYAASPPVLTRGEPIDLETFEEVCVARGYMVDDRIDEPGEVAVRGGVIDLFPADAPAPVRVEVADGRIVAIRSYDPIDQRTLEELDAVEIGRAAEPDGTGGGPLLDHLAPATLIEEPAVAARRRGFLALAKDAARFGRAPRTVVQTADWAAAAQAWRQPDWSADDAVAVARFVETRSPLAALARAATPVLDDGGRLVVAGSARDLRFLRPRIARRLGQAVETLASWDALDSATARLLAVEAPADAGFRIQDTLVVAAADLLGSRAVLDTATQSSGAPAFQEHAELHVGDVVVHEDHGIARLCGIAPLPGDEGGAGDGVELEFAGGTRRLVAAREANRIWRYGGDADAVTLDRLDGSSWVKRRQGIDAALKETAQALVALSIERDARTLPPIEPDPAAYESFASGFAFTETPDQARAIAAVRDDLASGKPMDRLVIGDVGYGKTEVALRAAAMVALAGGQVAIAAPTTVLVRQHLALFERRFEGTGIAVAGLSRLSTAAEKKAVKAGLADGSIHIVVGTAAVAARGVAYRDLALVVIDEEQRFGAADKARLRGLHDGHMLILSATPIPRTLQSALVGLQQMSIIATPPARRQPIRTVVESWNDAHVRTALLRERARRGQSFVVVPRIEDMEGIAARLANLLPEGEIVEVHGKMPAGELDTAMTDFAAGRGDVLLATNIIEAGLDVPRANTMIVWRADRFGLSQLHQLRGRVGRGNRRGQILLLTDGEASIAEATLKRLRTLQAFDRLGAGFSISARDLDLRGAGDLLGESQTGHMRLIGVDLYQHLLEAALRTARGERIDDWQPDVRIGFEGCLPESWLPDADLRVQLYSRLARLRAPAEVDMLEEELGDRFGTLPEAAGQLLAATRLRLLARQLGIRRIDAGPAAIALTPAPGTSIAGWSDAGLEASGDRYLLKTSIGDPQERIAALERLLETIAPD